MPVIHSAADAGLRTRFSALAPALGLALAIAFPSFPSRAQGAEMQPRSYAYLLSHAHVAAVGTVTGVSSGFLSEGRKARIEVDGLYKGKIFAKEIEVHWDDKEFEETAMKNKGKVVVFLSLRKDTTYSLIAPGISCWPVERVAINGKPVRAVEYAYPMDLMTDVPSSALRETEELEKSMNFQVTKRKQWILADKLLPPLRPVVLPKPKPKPKVAAKSPAKPKAKAAKPVSKGTAKSPRSAPGKTKAGKAGTQKSWFIPAQ
jgi:hypothetical protein